MTTTTTNAATENKITVESARANGLSMEEFFAANAGLTVEQYRAREEEKARKAEETAKTYALQAKIDTCKSTINFYDEKSRHAAWYLYNAVIKGDEDQATYIANDIAEFENKIAEAKKELADLEPATEETTAEDNVEEYAITPEAMDVAIAGEYSNCARASLLAFAAMIPAINTELKRICADEIKAHYYAEKVASESKPLDEIFSANVMPADDDDTDDELIDAPDPQTVERNSGNYGTWINGEYVSFEFHSIVHIDAAYKLGYSYDNRHGRRNFYSSGRRIAAAKIIERYMNGEIAAEQNKAHHEFFYAHKLEVGNPFKVSFEITTADGQEHFFSRTFDTFAEAKALVDEFTSTFSEPTQIVIKQNKQGGDWYYSRDVDGTQKFFDAFCKMNSAAELKAEEKNFTANCYYTYTKDDGEWNGSRSKNFATATEAANWIINLVRDNGYTLTDGNIRDWNTHKRYFLTETDFNAVNAQTKVTAAEDKVESYKLTKEQIEKRMSEIAIERGEFYDALEEAEADEDISQSHIDYLKGEIDALMEEYNALWAQLVNIKKAEAKTEVTKTEVKPAKVDRLDELKAEKSSLISAISHSLENHFIKLESGEFVNASDAGFTTIGIDSARPEFDKLYFKEDDSGEYVEVSDEAIDALHRLEVWLSYNADAIEAEIAKTKFKFEVGKWYASDETWNVNRAYRVLKRTKKFVTIYDPDIDDWNDLDNYDPDDEIDGEFDCISRKKIQYDERGEYVDWRDDDGELVTLCAKDETDKPVDDDDPKDEIDDTEDEIDAAEDNVDAESVNDEKPKHTADDFSAKLAELKAECDAKQVALIKAQDEHKQASEALQNCLSNIAVALKQKLDQLPLDYTITLKKVSGSTYRVVDFSEIYIATYSIGCDVEFHFENWKGKTIARYDTPEQVETVINMLKAAIERGDKEFTFPTVDELNQPSKDDLRGSLERAIEIARQKYREYKREGDKAGMRHESELFEICRKAIEELEVA